MGAHVIVLPGSRFPTPMVHPDNTPLHQRQGWTRDGGTWRGWYCTPRGKWKGEIVQGWKWEVFIFSPPAELTDARHPKKACFGHREGDKWSIHIHEQPRNATVDDVIVFVERTLMEAFGRPWLWR